MSVTRCDGWWAGPAYQTNLPGTIPRFGSLGPAYDSKQSSTTGASVGRTQAGDYLLSKRDHVDVPKRGLVLGKTNKTRWDRCYVGDYSCLSETATQ
jgi:hypothetical protein